MNIHRVTATIGLLLIASSAAQLAGQDQSTNHQRVVRIGGVAYKPEKVTIFRNLKTLLNRAGFPSDFMLYSDYDALNDALSRGEVEVAWNGPDDHAKFHVRHGGSRSLAMRDVDQDRVTLIVRADAGITSPADLSGKRLGLGGTGNHRNASTYYLRKAGVDLDRVTLVRPGESSNSAADVLKALSDQRSDAAVVLESEWRRAKEFRESNPDIKTIWHSPEICHCTFSAGQDFDAELGSRFTRIMTSLDPEDPLVAELNRLEGSNEWLPGNDGGFEVLVDAALKERAGTNPPNQSAKNGAPRQRSKDVVRLASVATTKGVTTFQNLKTYLNRKGFSSDFVLYSDHDSVIDAMARGEVDIMWSSPVPHARYHNRVGGSVKLAMRDADKDLRVTLVAHADSKIESINNLPGRRLVLGSIWNAEGTLLPLHYLSKEGVDIDALEVVSLARRKDSQGRVAPHSSMDVLRALSEGQGDAAVVVERVWKNATKFRKDNPSIREVWSSPKFCHCVFSAPEGFDADLGSEFTRLITNMDPEDPLVAELNRLEHAKTWLPGESTGFDALYEALENKDELLKATNR